MKKVSVIIVSYRVRELLNACLRSIQENGYPGEIEVIVVDNDAADRVVEKLSSSFPAVKWIQNERNVGFAPAVNQAASLAFGTYLLLLNPDAVPITGAIERLVMFLESHPSIGIVGPRLLLPNNSPYVSATPFPTVISILMYEMRINRLIRNSRFLSPYKAKEFDLKPFPVDTVEGSCMLIRRKAWEAVGGFDASYFFGFEEADLAWQMRRTGWEIWFYPYPAASHLHSASTGGKRRGSLVLLSVTLAPLYFLAKNKPKSYKILRMPLCVIYAAKWLYSRILGRVENKVAFREAVRSLIGLRPSYITWQDHRAHLLSGKK